MHKWRFTALGEQQGTTVHLKLDDSGHPLTRLCLQFFEALGFPIEHPG